MFHEYILHISYSKYIKTKYIINFWLVICIDKNFIWKILTAIF